jgi:putative colanic acid biosynthesis acetyltransferase WcaF
MNADAENSQALREAERAEAQAAAGEPDRTYMPPLRQRVFMRRSNTERAMSFLWRVVWVSLCRWTPTWMHAWRRSVIRCFRGEVASTAHLAPSTRIEFPWNLRIGEHTRIMHNVIITCMGTVDIGEHCLISQYAHICAGTHEYRDSHMPIERAPIAIGDNVWIAADVFVGPNVTIGDNVIIGARSSVFGDLPANIIAVGEPARKIKDNPATAHPA